MIKKRILAFVLCTMICLVLCAGFSAPVFAALNVVSMEYTLETSLRSAGSDLPYYSVLYSNGELWAYVFDEVLFELEEYSNVYTAERKPEDYHSVLLLSDVKAVNDNTSFIGAGFLALKHDGTLWACSIELTKPSREVVTKVVQIDSGVARIDDTSQRCYVKENGDVFRLFSDLQKDLLWSNVVDVGRGYYLTSDGILHSTTSATQTEALPGNYKRIFSRSDVTFVLNTNNELYGIGVNTYGQVGVGQINEYNGVMVGSPSASVLSLKFVMNEVVSMYFDATTVYARDVNGELWVWGDSEKGVVMDGNVLKFVGDSLHYYPRKSEMNEPVYTSIDGIIIKDDGTIWVAPNRYNNGVQIKLPASVVNGKIIASGNMDSLHTATVPSPAADLTARPTSSTVLVNGENVAFDAYNIGGNNYFKLRDLAYVLNGTEAQFEVGWDGANNAISLTSGKAYTPVGGEMQSGGNGNRVAAPTSSRIYLDGAEVQFAAYNIDGNNFFKLRDIMEAIDVSVEWDAETSTIRLDTSKPYTG